MLSMVHLLEKGCVMVPPASFGRLGTAMHRLAAFFTRGFVSAIENQPTVHHSNPSVWQYFLSESFVFDSSK